MPIQRLSVRDFSVFAKAEFDFSPGINVFIGANSTGKSHLMKLLYASQRVARRATKAQLAQERITQRLSEKLAGVYRPEDEQIGRLVRRPHQGRKKARVLIEADEGDSSFLLSSTGKVTLEPSRRAWAPSKPAIFLPSREVLAMYEGFTAAYEERELSFDETYYDVCKALAASPLRSARASGLLASLEKVLGGRVQLVANRFHVTQGEESFEAHLVAEGLRKVASVARLVANGAIGKGGTLFWDEPEANLNPRLIVLMTELLQDFARNGVQLFLASHDYLLTQRLSLEAEHPSRRPSVPMKFFSLFRGSEGTVRVESAPTLAALEHNPILREFARYYDAEAAAFSRSLTAHDAEDRK